MKYFKDSRCKKCGEIHAHSKYESVRGTIVAQFLEHPEYITRTCSNCGFSWMEDTLDTPTASPQSQG